MAVAKEIAEYLEDQSIGTVGTDIFVGRFYEATDDQVKVVDTAGLSPEPVVEYHYPGFQIEVRNLVYATGETKANAIFDLLHQLFHTTIESQVYERIDATASPTYIGMDEGERHHFVINFVAFKKIAQET